MARTKHMLGADHKVGTDTLKWADTRWHGHGDGCCRTTLIPEANVNNSTKNAPCTPGATKATVVNMQGVGILIKPLLDPIGLQPYGVAIHE